jgi:MerR family mercuric resistance operon transcriptional regulator
VESLNTLNFIRRCRELGFGLDDVRTLLALRSTQACCMDVKSLASRHLETVRAKLRDLSEMEASLAELVAQCPGDTTSECPVLEALDTKAADERSVPA